MIHNTYNYFVTNDQNINSASFWHFIHSDQDKTRYLSDSASLKFCILTYYINVTSESIDDITGINRKNIQKLIQPKRMTFLEWIKILVLWP